MWADELGSYAAEDLRDALEAMALHYQDYPPTLFQFSTLCRDARYRRAQRVQKIEPPRDPRRATEAITKAVALAGKINDKSRINKAWAHRILERQAAGDHVHQLAADYAKEVTGG